jgi:hypothetical protein
VDMVCDLADNPFERRQIIYRILEKLKLTNDEPLTSELLAFLSRLADD